MTTIDALRAHIGEEWFARALELARNRPPVVPETLNILSTMDAEPRNSGLSIEDAREVLNEAPGETFDLPHLSKLSLK